MATTDFRRPNENHPLFYLNYDGSEVNTVAFYSTAVSGASISFTDSWTTNGVYLFMDEAITDPDQFVGYLVDYLKSPASANDRFLWITNVNEKPSEWQIDAIAIQQNKTKGVKTFSFRNYLLSVGGGCEVRLENTNDVYSFKISRYLSGTAFYLETNSGQNRVPLNNTDVSISYKESHPGSLQFNAQLQANSSTHLNFDTLDAGLRYYIDNPDFEGYLQSLRYPIFETPDNATNVGISLNPVHQLDAAKTYFDLLPNGSTPTFKSHYTTNIGQPLSLKPTITAKLVFAPKPNMKSNATTDPYTLVPSGAFDMVIIDDTPQGNNGDPAERLMCGFSGIEYAGLMSNNGNQMHFFPDQASYAPAFQSEGSNGDGGKKTENQGLTNTATTSWAYITPESGKKVVYFAQPEGSVLHQGDNSGALAQYLDYLEVPVGQFPSSTGQDPLTAFPMAPYTGIPIEEIENYRLLELQVLSPARRTLINKILPAEPVDKTGDLTAVTPQGLVVDLNTEKTYWKGLTVGRSVNPDDDTAPGHHLQFTDIIGDFKAAVQSNQLFMVVNNSDVFQSNSSINYKLTRIGLVELANERQGNVPQSVLNKMTANPSMVGVLYNDKEAFNAALSNHGLTIEEISTYGPALYKYCSYAFLLINESGYYDLATDDLNAINNGLPNHSMPDSIINQLRSPAVENRHFEKWEAFKSAVSDIIDASNWNTYGQIFVEYAYVRQGGWEFNLSPWFWTNENHNTIVIFKYAGKSLEDMVQDTSTWSWKEAAVGHDNSIANTQQAILAIINDAKDKQKSSPDFENFVAKVSDPFWNGIMFLNVTVPLDSLPEQLQGLAAGIDPNLFYGHHLGINITPVENENHVLDIKPSSLFGLIYYDDPEDQFYDGENPYAFKVLSLKVLFQNSAISNFYSQIELLITKFFDEQCEMIDASNGNNLILNGVYQKHNGKDSYIFLENKINTFGMTSQVLDQIIINHAEFVTVIPANGLNPGDTIHTKFILRGTVQFKSLPNFDAFSFGREEDSDSALGLKFRNLIVHMDFPQEEPDKKGFVFDAGNLAFDLANSHARATSFYNHFPLKMNSFRQVIQPNSSDSEADVSTTTPGDLGFMSASTPLQRGKLDANWYGFIFQLDMGTLGSLTSDIGFVVEIFVGWAPINADEKYNVYIGVKLPGSKSSAAEIPIEGILKMVFKKIELIATEIPENEAINQVKSISYMLKFRSIALSLLGFNFPPGQIDMYIFGDPGSNRSALGWYACYVNDDEDSAEE